MELLENKLTVQEVLSKLLAENKAFLNDSRALFETLKDCVTPGMELERLRKALLEANIGEYLLSVDALDKDYHDQAKDKAIKKLQEINMSKKSAEFVVRTLTEAMSWNIEPPPPSPSLDDDKNKETQEEIPIKTASDYYNDGIKSINEKKYEKALENFSQAIKMNPNYTDAYSKRGMIYGKIENYDKAIQDYGKVIEQDSKNAIAYRERGICLYSLNQYDNALKDFKEAVQFGFKDKTLTNLIRELEEKEKSGGKDNGGDSQIDEPPTPPPPQVWQENGVKDIFLTSKGRLNRQRYILRSMIIGAIQGMIMGIDKASENNAFHLSEVLCLFLLLILVISAISHFMLVIRRLHDIDKSSWWSLFFASYYISILSPKLVIVSIIGWPLAFYILFKKGTNGPNRFGSDPMTNNNGSEKKSLIIGSIVLMIILGFFFGLIISFTNVVKNKSTSTITTQQNEPSKLQETILQEAASDLQKKINEKNSVLSTVSDLSLNNISIGMTNNEVVSSMGKSQKSYTEIFPNYTINEYPNLQVYVKDSVVFGLYSDSANVKTKRNIHPGTLENEIEKTYGSPYEITDIDSSSKIYMYKFQLDDGTPAFLSFCVNNGKVKYIEVETQSLAELAGAIQFLQYFHERITAHDFKTAYDCFSDNMKRQAGDYTKWADGYKNTVKSEIIKLTDADQSKKNKVILSYILKAIDNPGEEILFNGKITFIKVGDYFKIDDIENRKN